MNSLTHHWTVHILLVVCILLATVKTQRVTSNGLLKAKSSVELHASKTLITYPCPSGALSASRSCPTNFEMQVALTSIATHFDKQARYAYTVTGGRVVGEGSKVTWDLSDAGPGIYTATVEVQDDKKHGALSSVTVTSANCGDCVICDFPCPTLFVTCYDQVKAGTPITCKVTVNSGTSSSPYTYEWSARNSGGDDISERINGRGTSISISTDGLAGETVVSKVELKGLDRSCSNSASGSTRVRP